ncbi:MAG: outer membrane protein assembly factor BamE [Betaproteobacteria bacterium]|nr:outer membrane protein assembly factor BamE [Betaproteobacteria bacterium]
MRPLRFIVAILVLAGCERMPTLPAVTPYKMDIQQGNVVTQDMIDKVRAGMTKAQVRFALGTPLVMDLFHGDRWDYVYLYQKADVVTERRRIVVIFKDDKLDRIEGDVVPAKAAGVSAGGMRPDVPASATPEKPGKK